MKIFISQKMNGVSLEDINRSREIAKGYLEQKLGEEVEIIDSYVHDEEPEGMSESQTAIWYMSKSLEEMRKADVVFFLNNDHLHSPGCMLEHIIAKTYNLQIIYDDREDK